MPPVDRRRFLATASAAGVGLWASRFAESSAAAAPTRARQPRASRSANEKVVVAAIGVNGRGYGVAADFARTANTEVGFVCDVDARALAKRTAELRAQQGNATRGVADFRRVLENRDVDAVLIATPDHWHAPMAILALQAGKHVYLEKPASHNPREG